MVVNATPKIKMSWETVYWLSQLLLVLFAGVALVSGAVVNKRQSKQLLTLETTLEGQRQKTQDLQAANIEAQAALEKEKLSRLEMEKSIGPRTLVFINSDEHGQSNIEPLRKFPGLQVIINFAPDSEASRAAADIKNIAEFAGWKILVFERREELIHGLFDGVVVQAYDVTYSAADEYKRGAKWSCDAADALLDFLISNDWSAKPYARADVGELVAGGDPLISTIPPNTIRVNVGLRPAPYFLPKEFKEAHERIEHVIREMRKAQKEHEGH